MKKSIVLWTGGKDSSLALYRSKLAGYDAVGLVTFVPPQEDFLAHPIRFIKHQAEALGIPHLMVEISEPLKESYEKAITDLREKGIGALVTGDVQEVDGYPNWIRACSKDSGLEVVTPLWGCAGLDLLRELISSGFKIIFSCVKKPWFDDEWLGRELNEDSLTRLREIEAEPALDICGENGEYHTLVLDGPIFKKSISITNYSKQSKDSLMYLDINEVV